MSDLAHRMSIEELEAAGREALRLRRERHEPMVYDEDGWVVLEHSDGRIERIARIGEFKAEMVTSRMAEIHAEYLRANS
jgi:hypothetical protein